MQPVKMRFVLLFTFIASSILAAGLPTKKISAGSRGSSKRPCDLTSSLKANNGHLPKRVRPPKQTSFEQYIPPGTLTFVDQTGKTTSGPHAYDEYQSGVTVTIGLATGLTLNGKITMGLFHPHRSVRRMYCGRSMFWVYSKRSWV
ncbi:hypothetical protein BDP27DRAFT_353058 [Rhodocollybia butyracea]|uniref:Uncharacterized protein n=1 Tax=Rhodocollybia butyracea TaxID=206335 RepID=A0A9P5Q1P5_9AGAR|nr:hypothetical protein BDP27DRAFT_353058 [Rhodocollybia butyracea]